MHVYSGTEKKYDSILFQEKGEKSRLGLDFSTMTNFQELE
jgi:hypothetical protein